VIAVAVVGGAGRMGSLSASTVAEQDDLRLVAVIDPAFAPNTQTPAPTFATVAEALENTAPRVAVEFSTPASVFANTRALLEAGVHTVVGATGLTAPQLEELCELSRASGTGLLVAPNFSLGAALLMRFAREAARYFQHAEIIELHHDGKVDAPSGTALHTANLITAAEGGSILPPKVPSASPARGLQTGPVTVHSVRLPGLVAHQEVLFGGTGELLTLRHDSLSRESFMAGVLLAIRAVPSLKEPVVGLENILL